MFKLSDLLLFTLMLFVILVLVRARPEGSSSIRPITREIRKPVTEGKTHNNVRPGENIRSTTLGIRATRTTTRKPSLDAYANDIEQQVDELVDAYFKGIGEIFKNSNSAQTCAVAVADATNLVVEALKTL